MEHLLHRLYGVDAPVNLVFGLKSAKLNFSVVSVMRIKWDPTTTTPLSMRSCKKGLGNPMLGNSICRIEWSRGQ